jgi:PncC family amidohydrolase
MDKKDLDAVTDYLVKQKLKMVTAESCTAGMIASTLAEPAGCGQWLDCAYVTYSEDSKIDALKVSPQIIEQYGLTSNEVAIAMAEGALAASLANLAIATTGVAGPSSGDGQEPVGTVCIAWSFRKDDGVHSYAEKNHFNGDRNGVRKSATLHALQRISRYHKMTH